MHSFGPMNLAARQRVGIRLLESGIRPRSLVNTGIVASEANGESIVRLDATFCPLIVLSPLPQEPLQVGHLQRSHARKAL